MSVWSGEGLDWMYFEGAGVPFFSEVQYRVVAREMESGFVGGIFEIEHWDYGLCIIRSLGCCVQNI